VVGFLVLPRIASTILSVLPQLILGWDTVHMEKWLESPAANFLYVLLAEGLTVGLVFWFIRRQGLSVAKAVALQRRPQWRDLGYALLGTLVYIALFVVVTVVVEQLVPLNTDQEQAIGFERGIDGLGLLFAFAGLAILPPLAEEIIFRGFFYGALRKARVSVIWSTLLTSALFASLHLFGSADGGLLWIAALDTFVLSLVLCHVREETGSIWASIAIHALKNGFVFLNLFVLGTA
jgi:membrane protease YdiL (CAAX protease family)